MGGGVDLEDGWHGNNVRFDGLPACVLPRGLGKTWSDAAKDGDDEDVDGEHEKATLHTHHDLLPGDFQRTCIDMHTPIA